MIDSWIKCGDCIDLMKLLPTASIDLVVCDLPYLNVVNEAWDAQWLTIPEYCEWCDAIFQEYRRVVKKGGNLFVFTSRQHNHRIATLLDKHFVEQRIIIWARKRCFNATRGKALSSGYEPIAFYRNGREGTFNTIKIKPTTVRKEYVSGSLRDGVCLSDVWTDIPALPHNCSEKCEHPTQKPVKLIQRILEIGSNPGDVVLDNCCGSGTTGVACLNTGRKYILFDSEQKYVDIAIERCAGIL